MVSDLSLVDVSTIIYILKSSYYISPAYHSKFFQFLILTLNCDRLLSCSQRCSPFIVPQLQHMVPLFIYLLAQAINLPVRLISHSSLLLTPTELPITMIFPYKYFLRSLHYSYSHCHKFPLTTFCFEFKLLNSFLFLLKYLFVFPTPALQFTLKPNHLSGT